VTCAVAFDRSVQKCVASSWIVLLSCQLNSKAYFFSSFFNVHHPRNRLLTQISCNKQYNNFQGFPNNNMMLPIRRHQNVESVVVLKSCCWIWLCWISVISSRYSSLTSAISTQNVYCCLTHAWYESLVGKYPSKAFASPSKCVIIACFSSMVTDMSSIPGTSSI